MNLVKRLRSSSGDGRAFHIYSPGVPPVIRNHPVGSKLLNRWNPSATMSEDKNKLRKLFGVNPMHMVGEGARSKCWAVNDPKTHEIKLLKHVEVEG